MMFLILFSLAAPSKTKGVANTSVILFPCSAAAPMKPASKGAAAKAKNLPKAFPVMPRAFLIGPLVSGTSFATLARVP